MRSESHDNVEQKQLRQGTQQKNGKCKGPEGGKSLTYTRNYKKTNRLEGERVTTEEVMLTERAATPAVMAIQHSSGRGGLYSSSPPLYGEGAVGVPILQLRDEDSEKQRNLPNVTQPTLGSRARIQAQQMASEPVHSHCPIPPPPEGTRLCAQLCVCQRGVQVCVHVSVCVPAPGIIGGQ